MTQPEPKVEDEYTGWPFNIGNKGMDIPDYEGQCKGILTAGFYDFRCHDKAITQDGYCARCAAHNEEHHKREAARREAEFIAKGIDLAYESSEAAREKVQADAERLEAMVGVIGTHLFDIPTTTGMIDVLSERARQRAPRPSGEGWDDEHDAQHRHNQLIKAACAYALAEGAEALAPLVWPWNMSWWKPKTKRRNLVRAAALLIAEVDRLDRAAKIEAARGGK
jgi:hypothetical protein